MARIASTLTQRAEIVPQQSHETTFSSDSQQTGYILFLDDNHFLLQTTTDTLETKGYRVRTAETADEALRIIRELQPALILCDIMLPDGMDGYEFRKELLKDADLSMIPFVFVSAFGGREVQRLSKLLGASGHLTKPFDVYTFFETIEKAIN